MSKNIKELDMKVNDLRNFFSDELNKFKSEITKVKSPAIDTEADDGSKLQMLINRFEFFKTTVDNRLKSIESQVDILRQSIENIDERLDTIVQHGNRNKVLIFGVQEQSGEKLQDRIVEIVNSKLSTTLQITDMDFCYRIGKKTDKVARPVLVGFVNTWKRNDIFYSRKLFKGTKISISEVLSPVRLQTYKIVKQRFEKECWANRGKIGFKINGKIEYVTSVKQYHTLVPAVVTSSDESGARTVVIGQ